MDYLSNHCGFGDCIIWFVAIGFSVLLNIIAFNPKSLFEEQQITAFKLLEKIFFGLFYLIAHFLVIVFGQRLFKGTPPLFIATEKGFYYEPAGIGSGWILWDDIAEVRETSIFYGTGAGDILLRPSDFRDRYNEVVALINSKRNNFIRESLIN